MDTIRKLLISLSILILIVLNNSYAAIYNNPPKLASNKPIRITSDKIRILREKQIIIFENNVVAIQGDLKLLSDKMTIDYVEQRGIPEGGRDRFSNISRIDAEKNIKIIQGNLTANGKEGYYDINQGILEIKGDVVMIENGSEVKGERFIYNVNTRESTIIGNLEKTKKGDDGRVIIILDEEVEQDIIDNDKKRKK